MLPSTPTNLYLIWIRFRCKISIITSFTYRVLLIQNCLCSLKVIVLNLLCLLFFYRFLQMFIISLFITIALFVNRSCYFSLLKAIAVYISLIFDTADNYHFRDNSRVSNAEKKRRNQEAIAILEKLTIILH